MTRIGRPPVEPLVRFEAKYVVNPLTGCWEWTAGLDKDGYAKFSPRQGWARAARWRWQLDNGPVPTGLVLDHLCRVRACVNPSHLEPVTNRENVMRGVLERPRRLPCGTAGGDSAGSTTTTEQPVGTERRVGEAGQPAGSPHPSWGAVKRHRQAAEPLCEACRVFHRDYYRDYQQQALGIPAFRERRKASHRDWSRRVTANPAARARRNAVARARYRRQMAEFRSYVDPVVVDRLTRGEPVAHKRHERLAAARCLREQGLTYSAIAGRLGTSERQVHRDLSDLGLVGLGATA